MTDENKKVVKELFSEYLDLLEARKNTNTQIKEVKDRVADISGYKKGIINKTFVYLKKRFEDGENELDEIISFTEELGE